MNNILSTFGKFSFLGFNIYITLAVCLINVILMCFLASKLMQMFQLSSYKNSGYFIWLKENKSKYVGKIIMLTFLSMISVGVITALLYGFGLYYTYISFGFYIYFCLVFITNMARAPQKTPLKQTRRINRLFITVFVLTFVISYFLVILAENYTPYLKHAILTLSPLIMLIVVPIANLINKPLELIIKAVYLKRSRKKLQKMPNLIKIGITGSYGKTTTKHFLNVMLAKKYSVCMTPHSFNTPMGITKVILNYLKKDNEVLICEMGARNVGDIKYLCDLVKPKHGIITSVGSQHLSTFGSLENIAKTKNELVQAIDDGLIVFNANSEGAVKLYENCQKNKLLSGVNKIKTFSNITDIKVSSTGSEFTLNIENNLIKCKTKLVGKFYLENISMASSLAYKLGVSLQNISDAIYQLEPMPHRMEIINNNGLTILDDSYNCSVESSKAALETLSLFKGNKIIITPGIVEMGEKENQVNYDFGVNIAKVCDKVIIVNQVNKEAIKEGLLDAGFNEEDILQAESLKHAQSLLPSLTKTGDVILFENDLPDNYT